MDPQGHMLYLALHVFSQPDCLPKLCDALSPKTQEKVRITEVIVKDRKHTKTVRMPQFVWFLCVHHWAKHKISVKSSGFFS